MATVHHPLRRVTLTVSDERAAVLVARYGWQRVYRSRGRRAEPPAQPDPGREAETPQTEE